MTELSPDERALIELASDVEYAPGGVRDRIHVNVIAGVGVGAAVTATATATAAKSAAAVGSSIIPTAGAAVISKIALGITVTALGGSAVWSLADSQPPPAPVDARVARAGAAHLAFLKAPVTAVPQSMTTPQESVNAPPRQERGGDERPARGNASRARDADVAPKPASTIEQELALLRQAQDRLQAGDAAEALALLDDHERKFADGNLGAERQAARIFALCSAGRNTEAREAANAFLRQFPSSPMAARVRAACAK